MIRRKIAYFTEICMWELRALSTTMPRFLTASDNMLVRLISSGHFRGGVVGVFSGQAVPAVSQ